MGQISVGNLGKNYSGGNRMNLDLTDEEAAALLKELNGIIDGDRYFLSTRIKTLRAIRAKIRPEPIPPPLLPPPKRYEPPKATARQRRRGWRSAIWGRRSQGSLLLISSYPYPLATQRV